MREQQRQLWSAAVSGWQPGVDAAIAPADPITEQLIALAQIEPGQRVLDLSCGAGNPAFQIARRVGGTGFVLGLDIAEAMIVGTA
ncbi:MAG TPA: methyltransferase domain-containing protein, partial [Chloroflexota bacterium]|nr:methyltransferase domain-containing protein [Chloroflexota bacterium]